MATATQRRTRTPLQLATTAARLCKAEKCDTREFDDCFEQGNGSEVVAEFMQLHAQDEQLQRAAYYNERFINIASWRETAARVAAERVATPLFPVAA